MSQDLENLLRTLDMYYRQCNGDRDCFEGKANRVKEDYVPEVVDDGKWLEHLDEHFVGIGPDTDDDEDEVYSSRLSMSSLQLSGWYNEEKFEAAKRSTFVGSTVNMFNHRGEIRYDILRNAAHILSRLNDPKEWTENKNGLVYGMVQSGKTDNMCALSTLAFEAGYDFIIILTSDSIDLRQQTQERFDAFFDLDEGTNQRIEPQLQSKTHREVAVDGDTPGSRYFRSDKIIHQSLKQFIILPKNYNHLETHIELLRNLIETCAGEAYEPKFLVLDDEADYASLNGNRLDQVATRINQLITELMETLHRADYIGYTATPYGCIAADVNARVGYPRDFIWVLEPLLPKKNEVHVTGSYIGGHEVFFKFHQQLYRQIPELEWPHHNRDSEGENHEIIGSVEENSNLQDAEKSFLENVKQGQSSIPRSMVRALVDFITNGSVYWHEWWKKNAGGRSIRECAGDLPFYSAAFNPTQITHNQELYHDVVEIAWHKAKTSCIQKTDEYKRSIEDIRSVLDHFHQTLPFDDFDDEDFQKTKALFIEIAERKIKVFEANRQKRTTKFIYLLNSKNGEFKLDYDKRASETRVKKAALIIGGQKLSRGLTIEGLAIAYYARSQKTSLMDTVTQMARWFGHKAKYVPFMRVYMHDINFRTYRDITEQDENLRNQIKEGIIENKKPSEILYTLFQSPLFQVTNGGRMRGLMESALSSFSKDSAEYLRFEQDATVLNDNISSRNTLQKNLEKHGVKGQFVWKRGSLYQDAPVDLILRFFNDYRPKTEEIPADGTPNRICRYLEMWKERDSKIKFNVTFMGKEKGQLTRRQRKGIHGSTDDASRKQFAENEFGPILGGRSGNYLGDEFIDQPDHSAGREVLKRQRINSLLLIYELDPNYITRNPNVLSYEKGDERFLELTDDRGIIVYSLHFPKLNRPRVKGFRNTTLELEIET
jgi:hypothetical protein